jgi:hypothetical protein
METSQIVEDITAELLKAQDVLNTQFSANLAEPYYKKCLELIAGNPQVRRQVESRLLELFVSHKISDEPLAYLMHVLRWPVIKASLERSARQFANPIVEGVDIAKVLEAYEEMWENKEFYTF